MLFVDRGDFHWSIVTMRPIKTLMEKQNMNVDFGRDERICTTVFSTTWKSKQNMFHEHRNPVKACQK